MSLHPTQSAPAPWKKTFQDHLDKSGGASAEFILATVTPKGEPRARTCIFRGFWATLPDNEHNKLPKNPAVFESDCPTFTTDARMDKTYHVFATGKGQGDLAQSRSGTGGGGPVEAVFWFKQTNTQWRVRGKCWVVAADDIEGGTPEAQNSGTMTVKAEVQRYMRTKTDGGSEADGNKSTWSWRREMENYFENLSPMMRGSFKNPPPGQPLAEGRDDEAGEALGQKAGHLSDEPLARKNFRVAIITPEQVEAVDLTDPAKATRQIWTLDQEHGGPGGPGPSLVKIKHLGIKEHQPADEDTEAAGQSPEDELDSKFSGDGPLVRLRTVRTPRQHRLANHSKNIFKNYTTAA